MNKKKLILFALFICFAAQPICFAHVESKSLVHYVANNLWFTYAFRVFIVLSLIALFLRQNKRYKVLKKRIQTVGQNIQNTVENSFSKAATNFSGACYKVGDDLNRNIQRGFESRQQKKLPPLTGRRDKKKPFPAQ